MLYENSRYVVTPTAIYEQIDRDQAIQSLMVKYERLKQNFEVLRVTNKELSKRIEIMEQIIEKLVLEGKTPYKKQGKPIKLNNI